MMSYDRLRHLISPEFRLFFQKFIRAHNKQTIKTQNFASLILCEEKPLSEGQ